jgi:hypothetical protein
MYGCVKLGCAVGGRALQAFYDLSVILERPAIIMHTVQVVIGEIGHE